MAAVSPDTVVRQSSPSAPMCLPPMANPFKPSFDLPEQSCDAHVHVFGNAELYPFIEDRHFTPAPAELAALNALHKHLGVERCVVVSAGMQPAEDEMLLNILRTDPQRFRGVAVLAGSTSDGRLEELHQAGVRGVRVNLLMRDGALVYRGGVGFEDVATLAPRIRKLGWHVQTLIDAADLPAWAPRLLDLGMPLVVDHMGRVPAGRGVSDRGFSYLCDLLAGGRAWCKLSGADRVSMAGPPFFDAVPFGRALVQANPRRLVWGTDWPHVNHFGRTLPDDGRLVDLLREYAPDDDVREAILVNNPRELYGFD